jgi:hypothetical protein
MSVNIGLKIWYRDHEGKRASVMIDPKCVAFVEKDYIDALNENRCVVAMTDGTEIFAIGTVEELAQAINK